MKVTLLMLKSPRAGASPCREIVTSLCGFDLKAASHSEALRGLGFSVTPLLWVKDDPRLLCLLPASPFLRTGAPAGAF